LGLPEPTGRLGAEVKHDPRQEGGDR
jgi:hypothetical protein